MSPWALYLPSVGFCLTLAALAPAKKLERREWTAVILVLVVLTAYTAQLQARKNVWQEADRTTRAFIEDYKAIVSEQSAQNSVILCAPGAVGHIPTLLHYFEMRMRLETGIYDLDPVALAFAMLPADPARRHMAFERNDNGDWRIEPADTATTFLFPQKSYEFQQYPSGTQIKAPWGTSVLRGANTSRESTALEIRLTPSKTTDWRQRKWFAFDGARLVELTAAHGS